MLGTIKKVSVAIAMLAYSSLAFGGTGFNKFMCFYTPDGYPTTYKSRCEAWCRIVVPWAKSLGDSNPICEAIEAKESSVLVSHCVDDNPQDSLKPYCNWLGHGSMMGSLEADAIKDTALKCLANGCGRIEFNGCSTIRVEEVPSIIEDFKKSDVTGTVRFQQTFIGRVIPGPDGKLKFENRETRLEIISSECLKFGKCTTVRVGACSTDEMKLNIDPPETANRCYVPGQEFWCQEQVDGKFISLKEIQDNPAIASQQKITKEICCSTPTGTMFQKCNVVGEGALVASKGAQVRLPETSCECKVHECKELGADQKCTGANDQSASCLHPTRGLVGVCCMKDGKAVAFGEHGTFAVCPETQGNDFVPPAVPLNIFIPPNPIGD